MSNSSDEIADIRKRLEAVEKAIAEIRAGNAAKAEKVDSATKPVEKVDDSLDAMAIANAFMMKDHPVALPLKAVRQDDVWLVDVDIGTVRLEIVRVKIDANTGNILGHETIEKK
jgi:hypothetical protein